MLYVYGAIAYLAVGCWLTYKAWEMILAQFANPDKKALLAACLAIIVLIWPYWLMAIIMGLVGALISRNGIFYKIPFLILMMLLVKMYEQMWGIKLFPQGDLKYRGFPTPN